MNVCFYIPILFLTRILFLTYLRKYFCLPLFKILNYFVMEKSNANWDDVLLSIGRLKIPPHIVNVLLLHYETIIIIRVMYL